MTKMRRFGSIAALLAAGVLIGASADNVLSSIELRKLSPRQADQQFRRDLLSILRPMPYYPHGNRRLIGDAWTFTKAVATEYKPLCSRDMLSLNYEPDGREGTPEDWPVKPSDLTAERTYRFIGSPRPDDLKLRERDGYVRLAFDSRCRAADKPEGDNEWAGWFRANSPQAAMSGGFAMLALKAWAANAGNQFDDCLSEADPAQCKSLFASAISLDMIEAVGECTSVKPDETCVTLGRFGKIFTIRARKTGEPMRAKDILAVSAEQVIIVT